MPFELINVGATFQRAMDIAFKVLINKLIVIYLDDITIYSKDRNNHLNGLKHIFEIRKKYGISLNPKKSYFSLLEGKLLGFIVSKKRIYVNPDRVQEIEKIPLPHNKNTMQSFLGQINFVKRFVRDFSQIVLPLQEMIRKNKIFKWGKDERESFEFIKKSIINSSSLTTPDFLKPFALYTFSSDTSYVAVLTQLNDQNIEEPISFFRSDLKRVKLNYSVVDKQAFAIFKTLKHSGTFLLKTHTKILVPYPAVRQLLIQREVGKKRANWVTALQEYDVEIQPAKIVRGQGFFGMLTRAFQLSAEEDQGNEVKISEISLDDA